MKKSLVKLVASSCAAMLLCTVATTSVSASSGYFKGYKYTASVNASKDKASYKITYGKTASMQVYATIRTTDRTKNVSSYDDETTSEIVNFYAGTGEKIKKIEPYRDGSGNSRVYISSGGSEYRFNDYATVS